MGRLPCWSNDAPAADHTEPGARRTGHPHRPARRPPDERVHTILGDGRRCVSTTVACGAPTAAAESLGSPESCCSPGLDSRGDPTYSPTRPPRNNATGQTNACLNVEYASSTDGGKTWSGATSITDTKTNPNLEQFGGRLVPFFGDYITVAAVGDTIGAVWTDQRNAATAPDASGDNDGADVAGDPETGGACTSSLDACFDGTGGLDQNIYSTAVTP
jgi:hypothetical protein